MFIAYYFEYIYEVIHRFVVETYKSRAIELNFFGKTVL